IPMIHFAILTLTLLARPALQSATPAAPHPTAIAEIVVPAGSDMSLLADNIAFDQASGDALLSGSVVIRLPGGVELRPRDAIVFVHGAGAKEETRIYVEPRPAGK